MNINSNSNQNARQSGLSSSPIPPPGQLYYSVIRFVPSPVRGEFVNMGTIVTDMESRTIVRWASSDYRARLLTKSRTTLDTMSSYAKRFEQAVASQQFVSKEWLIEQYEMRNNLIQLSPPAPIAPMPIKEASDLIFEKFVA